MKGTYTLQVRAIVALILTLLVLFVTALVPSIALADRLNDSSDYNSIEIITNENNYRPNLTKVNSKYSSYMQAYTGEEQTDNSIFSIHDSGESDTRLPIEAAY